MDGGDETRAEVGGMWDDRDPEGVRQRHHPAHLRDAAHLGYAGLRVGDRAGFEHAFELGQHRVLPCRGRNAALRLHARQPDVVFRRPHRLLQPLEIEWHEPVRHPDRLADRPRAVAVYHDRDVWAGRLPRRPDRLDGNFVQLDVAIAALQCALDVMGDGAWLSVTQQARVSRQCLARRST